MEKLFSQEEIRKIENEAIVNFEYYHNTYVLDGNSNEFSIKTISKENHLIFVEGNEDTGFKHFNNRHSYFSYKNYWKENDGEYKLENPSKFKSTMIPIVEYVKICDAIFSNENKNISTNHKPEDFDKYTGYYMYEDTEEKYHFLTYKNTKIIHTFFPDKKKHNRKLKCKFGKGTVTSKLKIAEGINDMLLPYENESGITAYSFLIRKDYSDKVEQTIIQKHNIEGRPIEGLILNQRNFEDFETFTKKDMMILQHSELFEIEKIINDWDEHLIN